jgi:hypothetical protein
MKEQRYLLFPVNPKTFEPDITSIAVFPNMGETLKAKAFLKRSGRLVIILPIAMVESKEEFCELWKDRVKTAMLKTLGIEDSLACAISGSRPHS